MKVRKLNIVHFRCFEEYQIDLATDITVIIGKNGTGKTTLVTALRKALSFIFSTNKVDDMKPIASGTKELKVEGFDTFDFLYDEIARDYADIVSIFCQAEHDNNDLQWRMVKQSTTGALAPNGYLTAFRKFMQSYNTTGQLPLLAFFSDSYPHVSTNLGSYAKQNLEMGRLPRNLGYYQWNAETSCTEMWQIRLLNMIQERYNLAEVIEKIKMRPDYSPDNTSLGNMLDTYGTSYTEVDEEINYITRKLVTFSEPFKEVTSDTDYHVISLQRTDRNRKSYLELSLTNGRNVLFRDLPQGYKRLFSIVLDLAYRAYALNGTKEPEGVVLIDEIELHLHPSLAQDVLERLRITFPNVQFIVTTHSPLVVTNLSYKEGEQEVIKLTNENGKYGNEKVNNVFGIDYSDGLRDVMETSPRKIIIYNLINSYIIQKSLEREEKAQAIYAEIMKLVGEDNQYIKDEIEKKLAENL